MCFLAQLWADQCPDSSWVNSKAPPHDANRKTTKYGNNPVGQNMAASWNSQQNDDWGLSTKTQSWYDEVTKYQFPASTVGAFDSNAGTGGPIGHYTQVIWAETEYVGCGVIYDYDSNDNFAKYPYRKVII